MIAGRADRLPVMTSNHLDDGLCRTSRLIPFPAAAIYEAFARPEQLAKWWGPRGFTNAVEVCDFRPGGTWRFVMHGPEGTHHPNEILFGDLVPSARLVIHHVSNPRYVLTVTLEPTDEGTLVTWNQHFETAVLATRLRHILAPANEQNLDRLSNVLAGRRPDDYGSEHRAVAPGDA